MKVREQVCVTVANVFSCTAPVRSFLAEMGPRVDYTIAIDPTQRVNAAYMQAYRQRGIPCAFLIGPDLRVRWVGHPMALDEALASVCISLIPSQCRPILPA